MVRPHACYCTCQVHLYATNVRLATREPCSQMGETPDTGLLQVPSAKVLACFDHPTARSLDRENIDILPSIPL